MKCLLIPVIAAGFLFSLQAPGRSAEELPTDKPLATAPELVLQTGHFGGVSSVAFSPDGKSVLTGGNIAILWETATATVVRRFKGHKGDVETVAFSRDGKSILTGSNDDTAILWDAVTGAKLRVFEGGEGKVALSPDGHLVLMDSLEKTATLWDVATGKIVCSFEGDPIARRRRIEAAEKQSPYVWWRTARRQSAVEAVAFSADGKRVLTGEAGEQAILWDALTGQQLRTFEGHRARITSVAFSPDGNAILTGSWDSTAILWNADTGARLRTIGVHARGINSLTGRAGPGLSPDYHYVTSVAFSPDGKSVLTGSCDGTAVLTNLATRKELTFRGPNDWVTSVAFSPDGKSVLTGWREGGAILWDATTAKQLRTFEGKQREATAVAFSQDEKLLAIGYEEGTAMAWDLAAGTRLSTLETRHRRIDSVAFTPDGQRLLTGSIDGAILWDVATRSKLRTFEGSVRSAALTPDGKTVVTWPYVWSFFTPPQEDVAVLWNAATGKRLHFIRGFYPGVIDVAFSPNSKQVLISDSSLQVRAYEMDTATKVFTIKPPRNCRYIRVAYSPDGKQILTASKDQAILWDASTQKQLRVFGTHDGWSNSVSFSPDGKQILTDSEDQTIALWDANTGSKLRVFKTGQIGAVRIALFSPNGRFVVASDAVGALHVWDVANSDELCRIIALAGDDWLTVTPDGLFDGSPAGVGGVRFRIHNEGHVSLVPPEKLKVDFRRPGLLAHLLKGERPLPPEMRHEGEKKK